MEDSRPRSRVGFLLLALAAVLVTGVIVMRWPTMVSLTDPPAATELVQLGATAPSSALPPSTSRARSTSAKPAGTTGTLTTRNSSNRTGAYYLPSEHKGEPRPLLVAIHGTGGNGSQMVEFFRDAAARESFFIVAPDSRLSPAGQYTWQVGDHPGDVTEDLEHVARCVEELRAMDGVRLDLARVLVVGHSGGASTAPYVASNREPYTAFAVLHGGVFAGGLGPRRMRGWFSTGDADPLRPPAGVQQAADDTRSAGFRDVVYREFHGGHGIGPEELNALMAWWLDRGR